jgi:tol-pal system protein YbgF
MVPHNPKRGRVRPAILIAALLAGVAVPAAAANSFFGPQAPVAADGRIHVAQNNQNAAELLVRIQDLEETVRQMTGRIEGLEFQLQQMLKVQEDNDFRFQQLEGTTPVGKPQAAVPTDGVTPSDALPQDQSPDVALDTSSDRLPATTDEAIDVPDLPDSDLPMHGQGDSFDPLLNGGTDQLGTLEGTDEALLNRPLDLTLGGDETISSGDAKAQFEAGRDAMTRGDYGFASEQLAQFLEYYSDDPAAPDAVNYLGEALIQQQDYQQASQVLAQGYIDYSQSNRAPDIMLRLGVALNGLGQVELACENFAKLRERYPNVAPRFKERLDVEAQKAQCPAG